MIRMVHFKPAESAGFLNGEMGGNDFGIIKKGNSISGLRDSTDQSPQKSSNPI